MLYLIILIFFKIIEFVENTRTLLTNLLKDKIPEHHLVNMVLNKLDVSEKNLRDFSPFTIIISVILSIIITKFIINLLTRFWNKISNS